MSQKLPVSRLRAEGIKVALGFKQPSEISADWWDLIGRAASKAGATDEVLHRSEWDFGTSVYHMADRYLLQADGLLPPDVLAHEASADLQEKVSAFVRRTVKVAAQRIKAAVAGEAMPEGPQGLAMSDAGIGKTHAALLGIAGLIREHPEIEGVPTRVAYVVRNHPLAEDVRKRFAEIAPDLPCKVHLGMERPDPEKPDQQVCRRFADMDAVIKAGGDAGALCGGRAKGWCRFHTNATEEGACWRTRQKPLKHGMTIFAGPEALSKAPADGFQRTVSIATGEKDENGKPIKQRIALPPFDLIIVDEPDFVAMVGGCGKDPYDVDIARALDQQLGAFIPSTETDEQKEAIEHARAALWFLHERMVLREPGPLTADEVKNLAADRDWRQIRREFLRLKEPVANHITPSTPEKELREILAALKPHNAHVRTLARLARTIDQTAEAMAGLYNNEESGRLELVGKGAHKNLRCRWLEPIYKAWAGTPTLLLDATADLDIARLWFPEIEVIAEARAIVPDSVHRLQVRNSAFPYASWVPLHVEPPPAADLSSAAQRQRVIHRNIARIGRMLTVKARRYRGQGGRNGIDCLFILPKRSEEALRTWFARNGGMPSNLALEHFGNLRGLDGYGEIRWLGILSRPLPPAPELERIAWTLSGIRGTPATASDGSELPLGMLPQAEAEFRMRAMPPVPCMAARHPDPWAERVRRLVVDAELVQAEARARSIRRDHTSPLTVEILTSNPTDIEVDELITAREALADAHEAKWLAARGVAPILGEHGSRAIIAALIGSTASAVKADLARDRVWSRTFAEAQSMTARRYLVKLPDERYACPCLIEAATTDEATAILRVFGVEAQVTDPNAPRAARPQPAVNPFVRQMQAAGIAFTNPAHAAKAFPDIWTVTAARKAFQRAEERFETFPAHRAQTPLDSFPMVNTAGEQTDVPNLSRIAYQLAGPGNGRCEAVFDHAAVPDPVAWITEHIGPLAAYEVLKVRPQPTEQAKAAPTRPAVPGAPDTVQQPAVVPDLVPMPVIAAAIATTPRPRVFASVAVPTG